MEKKQFKAESQRLMDLMINSIYTHKEIFLREIISNASDAIDKLAYRALTDEKVGMNREDFQIVITPDKDERTLTVSDNGIGMTQEEMESNLGTIAKSGSLQFKKDTEDADDAELDIIGQFGVGFYSAFMVSDKVTVISRAYGSDTAFKWESEGVDGYTIEPCEKDTVGTDVIMHIKEDGEEEEYSDFIRPYAVSQLVKKYSDYIRYPIRMEMEHSKEKPKPEDAGDDYKPHRQGGRDRQLHDPHLAAAQEQGHRGGVQRLLQVQVLRLAGPGPDHPRGRRGQLRVPGHPVRAQPGAHELLLRRV